MTIDDFRRAAATRDVELAMSALADDVVVRSPLTDRFTFDGKADVRRLFETAYEKFEDLSYDTVIGEGSHRVLVGGGAAGGRPFEETLLLTLDEHDKIAEITLFIRPAAGPDGGHGRTGSGPRPAERPLPPDRGHPARDDRAVGGSHPLGRQARRRPGTTQAAVGPRSPA